MKERFKSFLLIFLVLLSLLLTYHLWYGSNQALEEISEDVYERVYFEEPRPQAEVVTPRYLMLHLQESTYLLRESDPVFHHFWNDISDILHGSSCLEDTREQLLPEAELKITLSFDPALPAGQGSTWLNNFHVSKVTEVGIWQNDSAFWVTLGEADGPDLETVYLPCSQCATELRDLIAGFIPEERHHYRLLEEGVFELPPGEVVVEAPIFVPAGTPEMDDLVMREEPFDPEKLVRTFFVNPNLVRVIEERDGSLIYTDGEKALRLSDQIDYSHPQMAQDPVTMPYSGALATASKLLGYYGGWPENLRLESFSLQRQNFVDECYHALWSYYYEGYPFFGQIGVWMDFNDRGLVEYRRKLYHPLFKAGNSFIVTGYMDAIQAVLEHLPREERESVPAHLHQVSLGYLVYETSYQLKAVPIWVVGLNGQDYYLCARSLSLLEDYIP